MGKRIILSFVFMITFFMISGLILKCPPKIAIAGSIGMIFIVPIIVNPTLGLVLIAAVNPFQWVFALPQFVSLSRTLGILVISLWLAHKVAARESINILGGDQAKWILGLLAVIFISWVFSVDKMQGYMGSRTLMLVIVLYLMFIDMFNSVKYVNILIWSIALSVGLLSLCGLANYFCGGNLFVYSYQPERMYLSGPFPRLGGFSGNPNGYAMHLLVGITIMIHLLKFAKTVLPKLLVLIFLGTSVAGVFLSASRAGILGLAIILILYSFRRKDIKSIVISALLCGMIFITFKMIWPSVESRVVGLTFGGQDITIQNRINNHMTGLKMFLDHPLTGVGLSNFTRIRFDYEHDVSSGYRAPHSIYLQILAELGIFGLICLIGLICCTFKTLRIASKGYRSIGDFELEEFSKMVMIGIFAYLVVGMFHTYTYDKYFWFLMALAPVLRRLYEQGQLVKER
ncbi:MAG: O-antigen ligase family protein [Desulfobacterales bacterium]|nr:O-antigen ligase family protein [Desulfobacterales bacterium]